MLSGPKILPDGNLLLEYVDGDICVDSDNTTKPFSVSVVLQCTTDTSQVYLLCKITAFTLTGGEGIWTVNNHSQQFFCG